MTATRSPGRGPSPIVTSMRVAAGVLTGVVIPVAVGGLVGLVERNHMDSWPLIPIGLGAPVVFLTMLFSAGFAVNLYDRIVLVLTSAAGAVFAERLLAQGWDPWAQQLTLAAGVLVALCWRIALTTPTPAIPPPRAPSGTSCSRRPRPVLAVLGLVTLSAAVLAPSVLAGAVHLPAGPAPAPRVTVAGGPQRVTVWWTGMENPDGVAFSPDGRTAYISGVADYSGADGTADYQPYLTTLDTTTDTELNSTSAGGARVTPAGLGPGGRYLYLPLPGSDDHPDAAVAVIDATTLDSVATVPVRPRPTDVVVSPDGRRAYVANYGGGTTPGATVGTTVSVIDTNSNTLLGDYDVAPGPYRLGISPDGRLLYVANRTSSISPDAAHRYAGDTLTIVDTTDNSTRILPIGDQAPVAALPAPDGRRVYIVCAGTTTAPGSVRVLDTTTGLITPLGAPPVDNAAEAALSPDGHTLVVPHTGTQDAPGDTVTIIDTATGVARAVPLDGGPDHVTITPNSRQAWVTTTDGDLWRIALTD